MKKARIKYVNNDRKEGYAIELFLDGEWVFSSFFPLVRRENADEEEEKNFVHFSLINKISELQELGCKILFH